MYVFFEYVTLLALIAVAATLLFAAGTVFLIAEEGIAAVVRFLRRATDTRTRGTSGHIYWRWTARPGGSQGLRARPLDRVCQNEIEIRRML
jgi:hypothetical protein